MNRQVLEEASDWFVEFRVGEVDAAASARFDEWLRRSPEHIRAYMDIAKTYVGLDALDPNHDLDVQKLIASARAGENVVFLAQPSKSAATSTTARRTVHRSAVSAISRSPVRALAASLGVLCIAAGLFTWSAVRNSHIYSTDIGERRSITLADGSTVDLNARSRIRVSFSGSERAVELTEGQALFEVAKDPARPFTVHSGTAIVRAVGTQFTVYKKKSGTTVTVVEGRVAVQNEASAASGSANASDREELSSAAAGSGPRAPAATLVSAGQQVIVTEDSVAAPMRANIASATAWIQHRLIFDGSRLSDVTEDFNRYNTRQLVIEDRTLDDFHISGAYSSTDPASLLRFLRDQPGIGVIETDEVVHIVRK
jgi:transmembrane sensor